MAAGSKGVSSRRRWLGASIALSGAAALGGLELFRSRREAPDEELAPDARFQGVLPFLDEADSPLDTPTGDELDGRLSTDLSRLNPDRPITPNDRFYIRTRASHLLDTKRGWSVRLRETRGERRLGLAELESQSEPQGVHLMECAGNSRATRFGLMSAASWDGVKISHALDGMGIDDAAQILISGFDEYSAKPATASVPGASWIFSRAEIEDSRAFLALKMNGQALTPDHGAPVRLIVPGWYGCACIKWVNEIAAAGRDDAPTSQMREYADRIGQQGMPAAAREYRAATVDAAAMPVRVEEWLDGGGVRLRVIGIAWGGGAAGAGIEIRFNPDEPYRRVPGLTAAPAGSWAIWSCIWNPPGPGVYRIRLRLADPSVRTRRLDAGYYVRSVRVDRA
jgi:DMSO/TMAO reductase YedYZ molybdopterin-dependent catalytic subunit